MATYFSDAEVKNYVDTLAAAMGGNNTADFYNQVIADAARYGVSADQVARATGFAPEQVMNYGQETSGTTLLTQDQAMEAAINNAYIQQLGRAPTEQEVSDSKNYLAAGGTSQTGMQALTRTTEGYNYDTQDITAAYRQALGRNPTQEEFVGAMSNLGIGTFDRSTLGGQQAAEAAYIAALEADPYGGRYANVNPYVTEYGNVSDAVKDQIAAVGQQGLGDNEYRAAVADIARTNNLTLKDLANVYGNQISVEDLAALAAQSGITDIPTDIVNVSQDALGNYVQYTNPVTQRPVTVTVGDNGELVYAEGKDVLRGEQAVNAMGMALQTGALTQTEYNTMMNKLQSLGENATFDQIYGLLSEPQAVAALDPTYGFQLGVGKTLAEAQANSAGIQELVNELGQTTGGYIPSNLSVGALATERGLPFQFTQDLYNQTYQFPTQVTQPSTPQQFIGDLPMVNQMLFGGENQLATLLSPGYYSERGFETGYTPIGQGPQFRSGVAGYTQNLPTSFNFGITPVEAPTPVFTPGIFNPNAVSYSPTGIPLNDVGLPLTQFDQFGNPAQGYVAPGSELFVGYQGKVFGSQADANASFPQVSGD